ncbi:hypothetical protein [Microvirga sp. Mcv34]|uniref:hypothetical protein n=1 Tax=Microvirga sp. Mcv34 TaxID=2926016 RepID=UPI0021C83CD3|nr:hypothetical protein [Microvirga sp. Mcv34]
MRSSAPQAVKAPSVLLNRATHLIPTTFRYQTVRSLHLVIGKLDLFAAMVHDRLAGADWPTKRDIICTLVKRIEVADDVVRVIFRVDPGFSGPPEPGRTLHHCPTPRDPRQNVARWH